MSEITDITAEGIHVKRGDTVVVAPLPERMLHATKIEGGEDGTLHLVDEDENQWEDSLTDEETAAALAYEPPAPPVDLDALRAQLWQSFDTYARAQTDDNSRVSISLIATNPASTTQQLERATAWAGWWSNLWTVYAVKRATLLATQTMPATDFAAEVGTAPYTIWEIAE